MLIVRGKGPHENLLCASHYIHCLILSIRLLSTNIPFFHVRKLRLRVVELKIVWNQV